MDLMVIFPYSQLKKMNVDFRIILKSSFTIGSFFSVERENTMRYAFLPGV